MREKLIELLESAESAFYWDSSDKSFIEKIADHLIANGVTLCVTDIKVGDKVYALYNTTEYRTRTGSKRKSNFQIVTQKNLRWAKVRNATIEIREKKCTKSEISQLGKTVFKTREDAEKTLEE